VIVLKRDVIDKLFEFAFQEEYRLGEMHIESKLFNEKRDNVNLLVGSINNWLGDSTHRYRVLVTDVSELCKPMIEECYKNSTSAFVYSVSYKEIYWVHNDAEKSYCVFVYWSCSVYEKVLRAIIEKNNIPIIECSTPLYPTFDRWFEEGFYANIEIHDDCHFDKPVTTREETRAVIDWLYRKHEENKPSVQAFRDKCVAQCDVCRELVAHDEMQKG
jgi:hypothetical protein